MGPAGLMCTSKCAMGCHLCSVGPWLGTAADIQLSLDAVSQIPDEHAGLRVNWEKLNREVAETGGIIDQGATKYAKLRIAKVPKKEGHEHDKGR